MSDFSLSGRYSNGNTTFTLNWSIGPNIPSVGFEICTSNDAAGPWKVVARASKTTSAYSINNVSPNATTYYTVRTTTFKPQTNIKYTSNVLLASPLAVISIQDVSGITRKRAFVTGSGDNLVDWLPQSINILPMLGLFIYENDPGAPGVTSISVLAPTNREGYDIEYTDDLQTFSAPNLTAFTEGAYFYMYGNDGLITVDMPVLQSMEGTSLDIEYNPNLTTINVPSLVHIQNYYDIYCPYNALTSINLSSLHILSGSMYLQGNCLTQASVDAILAKLVTCVNGDGEPWGNTLDISGGTEASGSIAIPSNTGEGSDYDILIGRGATIYWND